jgi:GDPmannose 4,6-dehydratase
MAQGVDAATGRALVEVDPKFFRPSDVECLIGDASRARKILGWRPKISFGELVNRMVDNDLRLAEREAGRPAPLDEE